MCSLGVNVSQWLSFQDQMVFKTCPLLTPGDVAVCRNVVELSRPPDSYRDDLFIKVDSNIELHGILYLHMLPDSSSSKKLVLLFHGNTQNAYMWNSVSGPMNRRGYDVLIPDYRQFGQSRGPLTEHGLNADAFLWYRYAIDVLKYKTEDITIYGVSIGCCMAMYVASRLKPAEYEQLCLVMPFDHLYAMAKTHLSSYFSWMIYPLFKFSFDNIELAKNIHSNRISVLYATDDAVIPASSYENIVKALYKQGNVSEFKSDRGGHQITTNPKWHSFLDFCFPHLSTPL